MSGLDVMVFLAIQLIHISNKGIITNTKDRDHVRVT